MGMDVGFDMIPRLAKDRASDMERWACVIGDIEKEFKDDPNVNLYASRFPYGVCIEVLLGERPIIPYQGWKFMRFSSKVTGSCGAVEPYIQRMRKLVAAQFGKRVKWWNEFGLTEYDGIYDWGEIQDFENDLCEVEYNRLAEGRDVQTTSQE